MASKKARDKMMKDLFGYKDFPKPWIEWNSKGKARERTTREVKCKGPYWADKCQGRWTDEYGSSHWCSECQYGNGKKLLVEYKRRPEYDAPEPGSLEKIPLSEWLEKVAFSDEYDVE